MDSLALQFLPLPAGRSPFSILMVDIDHFKQINDRQGHLAGDAALQQIGTVFRNVLRNTDVAGRYGVRSFLSFWNRPVSGRRLRPPRRIRSVTEKSELDFQGELISFSVSIGIATVTEDGRDTPDAMIQRADRCLYTAKAAGSEPGNRSRPQTARKGLDWPDKKFELMK